MVDLNRGTTGVYLPPQVSTEIWQSTQEASAVMRASQSIPLPGSGITIPVITGDPEADWVAETDEKPVDRGTVGRKDMTPYKLAVIVPFSNEFRRDLPGLYSALASRIPGALGRKFDETVFGTTAPGSNFDTLGGVDAVPIGGEDTYSGLVAADAAVGAGGGDLNGWVLAPQGRSLLLGALDGFSRPLFIDNVRTEGQVPSLLGQPVFYSRAVYESGTPNRVGFAGDWTSAFYGTVEGISVAVSDQATIQDGETSLNLWQRNMFAVRAEVEIGFVVRDEDHFVQLTDGVSGGGGEG
jgi:HK97 family phage major capsid protein